MRIQIYLLDTNAYLRLYKPLHPLLNEKKGKGNYIFQILKDVDNEFNRSNRLKAKFADYTDSKYSNNRIPYYRPPRNLINDIDTTYSYMRSTSAAEGLAISSVDIKCLAVGHECKLTVVSDDIDMIKLADDYIVANIGVMDVLHLLYDYKELAFRKAESIIKKWYKNKDLPYTYSEISRKFKELFGKIPSF